MSQLSILIPCYNDSCTQLVDDLHKQLSALDGVKWEILVGDDGSTMSNIVASNRSVNRKNGCRYVEYGENRGRAATRNALAKEATYDNLLFIDCGVEIRTDGFARAYINKIGVADVVCGGFYVANDNGNGRSSLRYVYEKKFAEKHNSATRQKHPYHSFRSCNFMISRKLFLKTGFNEDMKGYGYEDVALGKLLKELGAKVLHIDNAVTYTDFEDNGKFMEKTLEAMNTLANNRELLRGFSPILKLADIICKTGARPLVTYVYKKAEKKIEENLMGDSPDIRNFQFFKLGNLLRLMTEND